MCFDRKKMVTFLRNGIGKAANGGFIPIGLPGYYSEGYTYNPERAKEIVNTYCKNNNITSLPPIKLTTTNEYLNICEYIQREAYKVGLNLEIDVIPAPNLKESKSKGKLDLFRASWIADYPDAENYLSLFYSKNFAPNGPNYSHFKNKIFDNLYNKSLVTSSTEKRIDIYKKMDSLEISQSPIIPLFYDEVVRFSQNNIENLGINPTNLLNLKKVKKH
jgi:ABC-type transport system substrate-binding protein